MDRTQVGLTVAIAACALAVGALATLGALRIPGSVGEPTPGTGQSASNEGYDDYGCDWYFDFGDSRFYFVEGLDHKLHVIATESLPITPPVVFRGDWTDEETMSDPPAFREGKQ